MGSVSYRWIGKVEELNRHPAKLLSEAVCDKIGCKEKASNGKKEGLTASEPTVDMLQVESENWVNAKSSKLSCQTIFN